MQNQKTIKQQYCQMPIADKNKRLAVYVASWDGYSDLWPGFFYLFTKYWPECPYKKYLGINQKFTDGLSVKHVVADINIPWSKRVKSHLKQIDEKYVLMFLDDWYLKAAVDTSTIEEGVDVLERFDGHMLRLVPDPPPQFPLAKRPKFGMMDLGVLNRTNTHATIWRKETLEKILFDDEDLWSFEINGSIRSNQFSGGMFCVWKPALIYDGAVDRGKWVRSVHKKYKSATRQFDFTKRPIKTVAETLRWQTETLLSPIIRGVISHRHRQIIKSTIIRMGVPGSRFGDRS